MSETTTATARQLIEKVFGGLLDAAGAGTANNAGDPRLVEKAITDRYTYTQYFSVSEDGRNVTILDDQIPTDAVSQSHDMVDRYAVLAYRSQTSSSSQRDGVTILDAGTTLEEAQNYALNLVENNRNNVYSAQVLIGVPWLYAGRPVFNRVVAFYLVSRSADIDQKSGVPFEAIERQKRKRDKQVQPTDKTDFTTDEWKDPSDDLSIKKLAECVPTAIKQWGIRLAQATDGNVSRESLIFPYKTADGVINLNAVHAALKKVDNSNVPVSVRKAVKIELEGHLKKSHRDIEMSVSFIKSEDALARGLLYGVVYEPLVKDAHDDFATADEIEVAAHNYLPRAMLNVEHTTDQALEKADSVVVESYIAPCDFKLAADTDDDDTVKKGSWVLVTKLFTKELIEAVRKGEITGYSLEGTALKLN